MKSLRPFFLLILAATLAVALPGRAQALDVSFSFFHESLSPYGEWLEVGDYGYCWRPTGVDDDWAPYADGYWTYTDGGWTWVSYEDFGGIVYHYGRWVNVEDEGWCWKPDYEWAPAWVSWRHSDDYVGWAPLPPEAHWRRDRGFSVWVDYSYDIAPTCYNFVRVVDFGAPVLRPWVCHRRDNVFYVQRTVNITNISFNTGANCVFNGGPDFVVINRHARRPIPALKLVRNTNVTVVNNTIINNNVRVRNVNAVQQGNQLVVVAPNVIRPDSAQVTALVKPNVRRTIPQARVTKGWAALPAEERTAIRARFKQETKDLTPETAPARPVKVADLQAVPQKADPDAPSPAAIRKDRPRPNVPPRGKVTADGEPAATPPAEPPAAIEKPVNPRDAQRIAREKAKQKDAAEPKSAEVTTAPVPSTEPPTAVAKPVDPREAARIAREKARNEKATPEPKPADVTTTPVVRERPLPVRPGVTKPFNPATENEPPAVTKTPDADDAAAKRAAAQQAAQERAAAAREKAAAEQQQAIRQRQAAQEQAQEAARARAAEQQQQQQIIRQRQMDEQAQDAARKRSSEAAQERQKLIQQQQQDQSAARERAAQQQEAIRQRQAAQQSQEAARERAAQAAAQRQHAVESQQQQQAASARAAQAAEARQRVAEQQQIQAARAAVAERSQAQAARQHVIQQQQAQAAARAQAQNAARQQQPPPQQRPVPRGKRQLTPEEAEALKNQR